MTNKRTRNVCFTLNNYTEDDIRVLSGVTEFQIGGRSLCNFIVFQKEVGASGTPHLQGYMEFPVKRTWRSLRKINPTLAKLSLQNRRGTQDQAIHYCMKPVIGCQCKHCINKIGVRVHDTQVYVFGLKKEQGRHTTTKTNGFTAAGMMINEGSTAKQVREAYPGVYLRNRSGVMNMIEDLQPKRNHRMKITIYYSEESGTGKSYTANRKYPNAYHVEWPKGGRWWWNGYQHEEVVIMDEFRHQVKMDTLLKYFDYYPMKVETKGGMKEFNSKKIVITTNIAPWKWYPNLTVQQASMLQRRLSEFATIYKFNIPDYDEDGLPIVDARTIELQDREEPEVLDFHVQ